MVRHPKSGWYLDPTDEHDHRWWSGANWTQHVADHGFSDTDPTPFDPLSAPVTPRLSPDHAPDSMGAGVSSRGSLAIVLVGSLAAVVSLFLPRVASPDLPVIEANTLAQHGNGPWIVLLAVAMAGTGYHAYANGTLDWKPTILGGLILLTAIVVGVDSQDLADSGPSFGGIPSADPPRVTPSTGICLLGVSGILGVVGSATIRRWAVPRTANGELIKLCPACGARILLAARVCERCDARFDASS